MDDCLRKWLLILEVETGWFGNQFKREMVGKMPTEMFLHFFKSFSDGAKANINIKAEETMSTIKLRLFLRLSPKR
jgi:imidazoleglycerol-phosphate dehydratase/histidinol-phosphatase